MKKLFALMFAALLMTSSTSFAETFQATGYGLGPPGANPKSSFYKTYARQAARLDALVNLALQINGIEEKNDLTIEHVLTESFLIRYHISSDILKKAWQVGETKFEDGICEVTMETIINE